MDIRRQRRYHFLYFVARIVMRATAIEVTRPHTSLGSSGSTYNSDGFGSYDYDYDYEYESTSAPVAPGSRRRRRAIKPTWERH